MTRRFVRLFCYWESVHGVSMDKENKRKNGRKASRQRSFSLDEPSRL